MPRLFVDDFSSTLGAAIASTGATSLTLATGDGTILAAKLSALGYTLSGTDYLSVTILNGTDREHVFGTALSGDVLTITRGQDGYTAKTFPSASAVFVSPVASAFQEIHDAITAPTDIQEFTARTSPPAAPIAGVMQMYARTRAGRVLFEMMGPSGVDTALQPALFGNRVMMWYPGSSTGMGSQGSTPTTGATLSHPTPATSTLAESLYRTRFQTSTTAGNAAGARDAFASIWRGNSAGRGGFFLHHRVCSGSISLSGGQKVSGLTSQTTALAGEPSALPNVMALIKDTGDTNWQFARRTGTGTVQKVNLGVAVANNQTFDLILFCAPNSSTIYARIVQHAFDGTFTVLLDTSYTTDIPANTTLLARTHQVRNGATAAADNFELVRSYLESDY